MSRVKHHYAGMPQLPQLPTGPKLPALPRPQTLHQMFRTKRQVDLTPLIAKLMRTKRGPVFAEDLYEAAYRRYSHGVIGAMRSQGNRKEDAH